jgi:myo-inositol-1-phosphate synthase
MTQPIRVALAGVGNCASTLVQGLAMHHATGHVPGLLRPDVGGYSLDDIEIVAAVDVDARKVGFDLAEAIYAPPNNCARLPVEIPVSGVTVAMGPILDGVPAHLQGLVEADSGREPVDLARHFRDTGTQVVVNMVPTGSADAAWCYAMAALQAGAAFINGMPATLACDPTYATRAATAGVAVVGDDVKSQFGATIAHRALLQAMATRGIELRRTHQLNYGGNTDFKNLAARGDTKEHTKSAALTSLVEDPIEVSAGFAYVAGVGDRKSADIVIEGVNFGGTTLTARLQLDVEDSANFGGVIVDAIRACRVAQDRGVGGVLESASALLMKHPTTPMSDDEAARRFEQFLADERER